MKRILLIPSFALWCTISAIAQLSVQVMVQPPYSTKLEDYLDKGNNVIITVINTSQTSQQFKLIPSLKGNNGVSAEVRENFMPTGPIVMGPGESRIFNFNQLKAFNGNIQQNDVIMQGISLSLLESSGMLPEGLYTLCIKAIQFGGTTVLSGSSGCANFLITAYDPPVILVPAQEANVKMPKPQLLNFQWTPSGISGKTRYAIKLVDLTSVNVFNPNDAFNNPSIAAYFEQSNISTNVFSYNMGHPPLVTGRSYAVQVTAYDPDGKISYKNNGRSQAHKFKVSDLGITTPEPGGGGSESFEFVLPFVLKDKNDGGGGPPADPNDAADCMSASACQIAQPACNGTTMPSNGSTVNIGKFKLKITDIQGGNGNGTIDIPFLRTKVEVAFQNLTVNPSLEVCGNAVVWTKSAGQNLIPENMLKDIQGVFNDQNFNWASIHQHILQNNKRVSLFNMNQPAKTLPLVLDLSDSDLIILGIVFTPTAAYTNIAFSATLPLGNENQYFSLGKKGICLRPNGFGISENEAGIFLANDLSLNAGPNSNFTLKGGNNGTSVRFDCKGIKEVNLKGNLEFERTIILPLDANQNIVPGPNKFSVQFNGTATDSKNWIFETETSHNGFTSTQASGFKFGFSKIILDFSKTKNQDGMKFPSNHPMLNSPIKTDWTGIILQQPTLTLPNYLKRSDEKAITVNVSDIIVDQDGLWTKLSISNVIDKTEKGSLAGWGFSITKLDLDIRKSQLQGGGLEGGVNLPVTESSVGYNASYEPGSQQSDMKVKFGIVLQNDLDVDMIFAKVNLAENSSFGVEVDGNKVSPIATLHGSMTIGWTKDSAKKPAEDGNNSVTSFSLPSVSFQGFNIFNNDADQPQISLQSMQLANKNAKASLSNFPIKLKGNPVFQNKDNEVGLSFGLELTLSKGEANGLKGSADFTIFAKYDNQKRRFTYDRTQLGCIGIDMDIAVAEIEGSVCIYKNDLEFGDGFRGSIEAKIKGIGFKASATLQIGNVNNFDYFYFDGMVQSGSGINIPGTAASVYGFGGGFYYNMKRDTMPDTDFNAMVKESGNKNKLGYGSSGLKHTPFNGTKGFNAKIIFGLSGGEKAASAFNGDLTLWMEFNNNQGISKMGLYGNGYGMQSMAVRGGKAKVSGYLKVELDFIMPSFTLAAGLEVEVGTIIHGDAKINMHFSPQEWYIYIGSWEAPDPNNYEPWNDNKRNQLTVDLKVLVVDFNMYFMMGSNMPDLPPLPGILKAFLYDQDGAGINDTRKVTTFNSKNPGFAFGAGMYNKTEINALFFYVDITLSVGFDVSFRNYSNANCGDVGINGWYAKGQAYAYIDVEAGLQLKLWIWEGRFKLIHFKAGAELYAELPNPNYVRAQVRIYGEVLNGLIKVNTRVKFEAGTKLQCQGMSNPFADVPIVSEIYPESNDEMEVYDNIRVAFNYPKDLFEVYNPEEPEKAPKYYYYKIEKITVKNGNKTIPLSDPIYSKDNYSCKFLNLNGIYDGNAKMSLNLLVSGYENGAKTPIQRDTHHVNFVTADLPDKFIPQILKTSNPLPRQRFYLYEDSGNQEGFVMFKSSGFCYLFDNYEVDSKVFDISKTKYLIQFTETGTGKVRELPCSCKGELVNFYMPQGYFKKETIYRMKVIQRLQFFKKEKSKPKMQKFGGPSQMASLEEWKTGSKDVEITKGSYKISRYLLEDPDKPKTMDVDFWEIFFRTSKYETLTSKLNTYKVDQSTVLSKSLSWVIPKVYVEKGETKLKTTPEGIYFINLPVALMTGGEAFDKYDLVGYTLPDPVTPERIRPNIEVTLPSDHKEQSRQQFYTEMMSNSVIQNYNIFFPQNRTYDDAILEKSSDDITGNFSSKVGNDWVKKLNSSFIWQLHDKNIFGSLSLPKGRNLWSPAEPLSKSEIDEAMAATSFEKQDKPLQFKLTLPPLKDKELNLPTKLSSNEVGVLPLVNVTDYLLYRDYAHYINQIWYFTVNSNKASVKYYQDQIKPLLNRPQGKYNFKWGGVFTSKVFDYDWKSKNMN
ncbi:MAG: hypothetical protein IPM42_03560 [Saprospiraceae bacterium]|nr:hypothetical protein [Saprospiraceae bacterium]